MRRNIDRRAFAATGLAPRGLATRGGSVTTQDTSDQCYAAGCKQPAMDGAVLCKEHHDKLPAPMRGEQPPKDELFHQQPPLVLDYGGTHVPIASVYYGLVSLLVEADLDVEKARLLRDWLNKVIPS